MTIPPIEEWSPVYGFEGFYSVSNHCRVRSEERRITHPGPWNKPLARTIRQRILRQKPSGEVSLSRDGKTISRRAAALMADAFGQAAA
jgi:hypothetical protein